MPPLAGIDNPFEMFQEQIEQLNEALERETKNSKALAQKCEEYLGQIQRSADILENSKEKHDLQLSHIGERLDDVENLLKIEQEKVVR